MILIFYFFQLKNTFQSCKNNEIIVPRITNSNIINWNVLQSIEIVNTIQYRQIDANI